MDLLLHRFDTPFLYAISLQENVSFADQDSESRFPKLSFYEQTYKLGCIRYTEAAIRSLQTLISPFRNEQLASELCERIQVWDRLA